ncbi:38K [Urbanus proteus nucleopolyhedrovirus]|uniref:38K n=1 Tax=Urbanus proteus nucleopolyhedrovirus TaxID=1675866 RepID=A0A161C6Y8_9ABAC|nr:38K [Urbanus proteus nucleopolyhedrovirus]AKR17375.1 38K [Urbanus proteus nucleopolyhedrovirus]
MSVKIAWLVLRRRVCLLDRQILVLNTCSDLMWISDHYRQRFEFVVCRFDTTQPTVQTQLFNTNVYETKIIFCNDNMVDVRIHLKLAFKTSVLGHVFCVNDQKPMYNFLKEWHVSDYGSVLNVKCATFVWESPHVIVFDLDHTLITDDKEITLRDKFIHKSLQELKRAGCVLILWSYGNKYHVTHSLKILNMMSYFDIIICNGRYEICTELSTSRSKKYAPRFVLDYDATNVFVETMFDVDVNLHNKMLPKSPKVVLHYVKKIGITTFKSLTLVDDLATNNYNYDYFINVKKSYTIKNDWNVYHDALFENFIQYDNAYSF